MEDLTIRGKVMNYYDTFNVTQLKGIIKHVVRMHARVLTMEPEAWSGKFLDNQDAFDDIGDITKNALQPFKELAKDRCPLAVELTDKYAKFLVSSGFIHYAFSRSYKDLDLQPVCVHGDLWTSNIMMAVDENGDYTNDVAAFVDWQIIHEGGPMDDLARVVTVCADGNVRREVETFLIDFYLENLAKELEGTGVQVPYTADKLQEAYDYMFLEAYDYMFLVEAAHPLFMVIFLRGTLSEDPKHQRLNKAKLDNGVLRALHALEDLDRLLSGKYKFLFDKYGK
uniref:CHK kinase-like domain-containing protein n=1 Tax=Panagrolaimus sp. JU765 TaxID=591449 RepID=A0AC34QK62_9BILA